MATNDARVSRRGRPTLEKAAQLKSGILEATLELLSHRGIKGTSMEMVAQEAQVTKRTIYRHFADKDELIGAAVSREIERLENNAVLPPAADVGSLERVKYYCQRILPSLQEPRLIRFFSFLMFEGLTDPSVAAQARLWFLRGQAPMLQLVTDAVGDGLLKGSPLPLTLLLMDLMIAGPLERTRMGMPTDVVFGGPSLETFVEERWAIFLSLL